MQQIMKETEGCRMTRARMKYENPVIRGFHPDPSVCRVGEDYYLVTSSFEYFPAIPVFHSADLVNWTHVANAVSRASQLPLTEADASGGVWAPAIRSGGERFYIVATFSSRGNFLLSADDPRGEWSDVVWLDMDGIDPSLFFEGGRMYCCANDCGSRETDGAEGISLAEIDPATGKTRGKVRRIWTGTGGGWLEAPHIYRIGGRYYLLAAEGGTRAGHTAVLAWSGSLWGPYAPCPFNPILTNRNDTSKRVACAGHADLIDTPDDDWFMVHLATRPYTAGDTPLGRETFLTPVCWKDGWFFAEGGKARIENEAFLRAPQAPQEGFECDFASDEWEPRWLFVRGRDERFVRREDGALTLRPANARLTDAAGIPAMAAVRQPDFECEAEIELDFMPEQEGDEAGLAVYLSPRNVYRIAKRRAGGADRVVVEKRADDFAQTVYSERAPEGRLRLRVRADREKYAFFWAAGGGAPVFAGEGSARFLTTAVADRCFTGTVIGAYAQAERETTARAVVHRYALRPGAAADRKQTI